MTKEWMLQSKEMKRKFCNSTWVPLRASCNDENGNIKEINYKSEYFGCGSVAFPPEHRNVAEKIGWGEIGIGSMVQPYAYPDGYYSTIDQYQYNDKEPIGVHFVFEHPQPLVGGKMWILNPDLIVALRLVKEGSNWVRPEENYVVVAREVIDNNGFHRLIEIKREFLMDYLAARNLALRLSYYRQRIHNVNNISTSVYASLTNQKTHQNGGEFSILIRKLDDIYGGNWESLRVWRTEFDDEEDAPVLEPESDENTDCEQSRGRLQGLVGERVESEFWCNEWIDHQSCSVRIRGDVDKSLPQFIVGTDGERMDSADLNDEDIGRWLWFSSSVISELLSFRGFGLEWYTSETGGIYSASGRITHFGINNSDLITVYACDVPRLESWEQRIWAAHNVVPDGKVSSELLDDQVRVNPAKTKSAEVKLLMTIHVFEQGFRDKFNISIFNHEMDEKTYMKQISRFAVKDLASLLRLAKEIIRVFSDRLNVQELRKLSKHKDKEKFRSNKLLQDILSQKVGTDMARQICAAIVGVYDMRVGDAHPTGSNIDEAIKLVGIDVNRSYLKQAEQLIEQFGKSVWGICEGLFADK